MEKSLVHTYMNNELVTIEKENNTLFASMKRQTLTREEFDEILDAFSEVIQQQEAKFCCIVNFSALRSFEFVNIPKAIELSKKVYPITNKFMKCFAIVTPQTDLTLLNLLFSAVSTDERLVMCDSRKHAIREATTRFK